MKKLTHVPHWLVALFLTALCLSACIAVGSGVRAAVSNSSSSPHKYTWMIANSALQLLEQADSSGKLAKTYFDTPDTYLLGAANASGFPAGWQSVPTAVFSSYAAIQQAFTTHAINAQVKAIVYDNEDWSFTPVQEQHNPGLYDRLAAELVHQHHLIFIATPATDLARVLDPFGKNVYQDFLNLGIAREAARYADIYEIQAQGSEMNTSTYATFVKQAAAQAQAANPHVKILAGLSTNPTGHTVTGKELYQAVLATQSSVIGYWLNIPSAGSHCPTCGQPQPQVAVDLLEKLSGQS